MAKGRHDGDVSGSESGESSVSTEFTGGIESGDSSNSEGEKFIRESIVKQEERAVQKARLLVAITVIALTVSVSTAVFYFASQSDQATFELAYDGFVSDIVSLVHWENQYNFALMEQLAASVTSAALMTNATFPYLTQPHFEITGGFVDGMGGIMSASFSPLIRGEDQREWEMYATENKGWLQESAWLRKVDFAHQDALHGTIQDHEHDRMLQAESDQIAAKVYRWQDNEQVPVIASSGQVLAPIWQVSPPDAGTVNADVLQDETIAVLFEQMKILEHAILSPAVQIHNLFDFLFDPEEKPLKALPHSYIIQPVLDGFDKTNSSLVGILIAVTTFENLLDKILPVGSSGIHCVISDTCGNVMSFNLVGTEAIFLGYEDLHDPAYNAYKHSTRIDTYDNSTDGMCLHTLDIYPSTAFEVAYQTNKPAVYTSVVVLAFIVTSILILVYDIMVTRRQEKTMVSAIRSGKLVASLFPSNVVDRVMEDAQRNENAQTATSKILQNLTDDEDEDGFCFKTRPIADFFPNTTIMFADISGFTAWASTREPFQVFQLLETLFGSLDRIARARKIFKVETVGDCYVAVCGLPNPCKDHAVVMCRFARDCHSKMKELTRKMEVTLGPDTADLALRIGLHSGPVTGGVLRGDNARFQLFGDAMNTASRIESTGERNRTHISKTTADLLMAANKQHWVKARNETVIAKGKGELETFWLSSHNSDGLSSSSSQSGSTHETDTESVGTPPIDDDPSGPVEKRRRDASDTAPLSSKDNRLIDWNVAVLQERLRGILESRRKVGDASQVDIDPHVQSQLRQYVVGIAAMYPKNPFHNFMHASHVTMSVTKMLSRVVTSDDQTASNRYAKGITSDPLALFAVVFSALVHDVDHPGVSNARLVEERAPVAAMYDNKSVAEKNSIDVALEFLMQPDFAELRAILCPSPTELDKFRSLVRHIVLATDIVDKELKDARNARWSRVFGGVSGAATTMTAGEVEADRLKATIVLEHLIQASDVVHTMQHWHVYIKWNACFFREMYHAYQQGRADQNPVDSWYHGELGFFDYYIIPLAKKLHECGVFGVSSDEFLNYATNNRSEWESKGREIVEGYVEQYCREAAQAADATEQGEIMETANPELGVQSTGSEQQQQGEYSSRLFL